MTHHVHEDHTHTHSEDCGHTAIKHEGHICYVHDNHLHREHEGHYDECVIEVNETNPSECNPVEVTCLHNEDCGHESVPHGDHVCYIVDGRLEHVHGDHVDDHGPIEIVQ